MPNLSEIALAIVDCEHKTAPTQSSGIPSIRTTNITNGRLDLELAKRVSEETYREWTARMEPQEGDLILAREAPVGEVGIVPANTRVCLGQRTVLVRPNSEKAVPRYLLYLLLTPEIQHELKARSEGSTTPHLNVGDIREFVLPELPGLPDQRRIAHILGTLDDKIELNRRMNRTLEAIAWAIFKSWFVDFDPVHAKAEGREPAGMNAETAALFPDSFQDSPLGKIPNGWEIVELNDLLKLNRESIKPQECSTEEFDHYSIPAYDSGSPVREVGHEIRSSKHQVPSSAVLISKLNPHIPRVWFPNVAEERRSICSTEFLVCTPQEGISREYLYSLLSSSAFLDQFAQMVTGTTGSHQRVRPKAFTAMKVVNPSPELLATFTRSTEPLFARCASAAAESGDLATTRDVLLPRLLSGSLRVGSSRLAEVLSDEA